MYFTKLFIIDLMSFDIILLSPDDGSLEPKHKILLFGLPCFSIFVYIVRFISIIYFHIYIYIYIYIYIFLHPSSWVKTVRDCEKPKIKQKIKYRYKILHKNVLKRIQITWYRPENQTYSSLPIKKELSILWIPADNRVQIKESGLVWFGLVGLVIWYINHCRLLMPNLFLNI